MPADEPAADPTPDQATAGAALRSARETAGLTVEDVAARTRIRATLVRDLEADRFASSGAPVYARGHIRSICSAVGADPAPVVALFDRATAETATPLPLVDAPVIAPTALPQGRFALPTAQQPERHGPNWAVAGVAAAAVLVGLIAVGTLVDPGPQEADTVAGESPLPSARASESPRPLPSEATAQVPAFEGADLRIRVIGGASWVRVRNSARKTLFEGVLADGVSKDFRDATSLNIVVGNAGAVSLVCSGRDLARAGGNGKIARFTCSDTGLVSA